LEATWYWGVAVLQSKDGAAVLRQIGSAVLQCCSVAVGKATNV